MANLEELLRMASTDTVSDELLAAYIDGNTTTEENDFIESSIPLGDINDIKELTTDSLSFEEQLHFYNGDYGYWELGIPPVLDNQLKFIDMKDDLNQGFRTYGESAENLSDPIFIQQPDDHSCALRSQQIILRDFGIDIPFDDLEKIALEAGVYSDQGTYTYDIGKVLEIAGVGMHQVDGSTIYDLTNELAQGHRVIVSVDADELWYNDTASGKINNWISDAIRHQGGNHALIVAGIEVNVEDPNDVKVVLTDPGAGHLRIEYPMDQFMDAWQDSNCFMAATDNAAPYQYDALSGMEVPSNFVVEQHFNDFITQHSWQLSGDNIADPENYHPAFTGHIDNVGNVSYESFIDKFHSIVSTRRSFNGNTPTEIMKTLYDDIKGLFVHSDHDPNNQHNIEEHHDYQDDAPNDHHGNDHHDYDQYDLHDLNQDNTDYNENYDAEIL